MTWGWLQESSEADKDLNGDNGHDHGEGELEFREVWKDGTMVHEGSGLLGRILTFFKGEIFTFYPSVCWIGRSSEKPELWGKGDVNFFLEEMLIPLSKDCLSLLRDSIQSSDINSSA